MTDRCVKCGQPDQPTRIAELEDALREARRLLPHRVRGEKAKVLARIDALLGAPQGETNG